MGPGPWCYPLLSHGLYINKPYLLLALPSLLTHRVRIHFAFLEGISLEEVRACKMFARVQYITSLKMLYMYVCLQVNIEGSVLIHLNCAGKQTISSYKCTVVNVS